MGNRAGRRAQQPQIPPYGGNYGPGFYPGPLTSTYLPQPRGYHPRCHRYPARRPYY